MTIKEKRLNNTALYRKTPKGILTNMYGKMKYRSALKGLPPVGFTLVDFHDRYLKDSTFLNLVSNWASNGYSKQNKPSVDRINLFHGYTFDNIKIVTWAENRKKADWEKSFLYTTAVNMFDENGNKLRTFESIKEAHIQTKIHPSLIIQCCQGRVKRAKGHIFQYRGDKHRTNKTRKYANIHDTPSLLPESIK